MTLVDIAGFIYLGCTLYTWPKVYKVFRRHELNPRKPRFLTAVEALLVSFIFWIIWINRDD